MIHAGIDVWSCGFPMCVRIDTVVYSQSKNKQAADLYKQVIVNGNWKYYLYLFTWELLITKRGHLFVNISYNNVVHKFVIHKLIEVSERLPKWPGDKQTLALSLFPACIDWTILNKTNNRCYNHLRLSYFVHTCELSVDTFCRYFL